MKHYIVSNVTLPKDGLDEITELLGVTPVVSMTTATIRPKYNPYFNAMWGDFDWMRTLFPATDTAVRCYVTSPADLKAKGITGHIGMYNMTDKDGILDFYFALPTRLDRRAKANGFRTNLAWLYVHEFLHGKEQDSGMPDRVHAMQDQGRLKELLTEHQVERPRLYSIIATLTAKLKALSKPKMVHPVAKQIRRVTQTYGNPNPMYKLTKHHIGIDYGMPIGTPIYAPVDGEVVEVGTNNILGNYLHYRFIWDGVTYVMRCCHLNERPQPGVYKCGDEIGYSGNTGMSTGPHLHLDLSIGAVNLVGINQKNWQERFINPDLVIK